METATIKEFFETKFKNLSEEQAELLYKVQMLGYQLYLKDLAAFSGNPKPPYKNQATFCSISPAHTKIEITVYY